MGRRERAAIEAQQAQLAAIARALRALPGGWCVCERRVGVPTIHFGKHGQQMTQFTTSRAAAHDDPRCLHTEFARTTRPLADPTYVAGPRRRIVQVTPCLGFGTAENRGRARRAALRSSTVALPFDPDGDRECDKQRAHGRRIVAA